MNNVFKSSLELTLDDFRDYPFWVWCEIEDEAEAWYDDIDSSTCRAYTGKLPVDDLCGICRTDVHLNNGATASGLAFYNGKNLQSPELFLGAGRIALRTIDHDGKQTQLKLVISALEDHFSEPIVSLFPIEFRAVQGILTCQHQLMIRCISNVCVFDGSMKVEKRP